MFVAHEAQLVRVPDSVTDEEAVLVEPFACSVHAVRSAMPSPGERVLVIGAGSIGLLTVAALKALAPSCHVTVLARHAFQAEHATRLGAERVVFARGDYVGRARRSGAARGCSKPIIGKPVGVGGFDRTFICIGGARATDDAMRVTRAGGTLVLLGNSARMDGIDWTPLWLKELTLRGSLCYGEHRHVSPAVNAFREATNLIAARGGALKPLMTHVYPLADYRAALATAMDKKGSRSIKVGVSLLAPSALSARFSAFPPLPRPVRAIDLRRELTLDPLGVERPEHILELRIGRELVPKPRIQSRHQLQRLRDLLLSSHQHLEHDLLAQLGHVGLAALCHQH